MDITITLAGSSTTLPKSYLFVTVSEAVDFLRGSLGGIMEGGFADVFWGEDFSIPDPYRSARWFGNLTGSGVVADDRKDYIDRDRWIDDTARILNALALASA